MAKLQFATLSNLQEFLNLHNVQIDSKISEAVKNSIKTVSQSEDGYTLYFYTKTAPVTIDEAAFTITIPQPTGKADKVKGAISGHLAGLDANGNLIDSGKAATDFDAAGAANTAKTEVMSYVGTIPADAKAKDVVSYIKEAVKTGTYDDSALKSSVAANTAAISTLTNTIYRWDSSSKTYITLAKAVKSVAISESTENGKITLTVDGNKTTVPVHGLGSAAYTNSSAYSSAGHTHTKAQVGLGNVDNTADANKSVKHATTADSATTAGTATNVSAGEGTADAARHVWFSDSTTETKRAYSDKFKYNPVTNNLTVNVTGNAATASSVAWGNITEKPSTYAPSAHNHNDSTITSLNASKLFGTIDIARLPHGALERLIIVEDDTARFKLTTANIQLGDTVKVTKTEKMYYVVDESKLSSEAGYSVYTAGTATSVPWSGVTEKPSSYPPASHNHDERYYTETEMNSKLAEKATKVHTHTKSEVGLGNVDNTADATKSVKYAISAGSASSAAALTSNAGSSTQPVYFSGGKPVACSYTLGKSVPADALFTDHTYGNMKGATSSSAGSAGLVPAPNIGEQLKFLRADGAWVIPTNTTYSVGTSSYLGITKLYTETGSATDGTMTQNAITSALNGKSPTSHTHNYAGSSSSGGAANSANKLATARTVSGGTDITLSFNYDGSGNSSANIGFYSSSASVGDKNNYPFHRFAKLDTIAASYSDKSTTFFISQDYSGGGFGIVRIVLRTNNSSLASTVEVKWLVRCGLSADSVQVGIYNVFGKTYADAFFKTGGSYAGTCFRTLASGARGGISRTWVLVNSSEVSGTSATDAKTSTECYATIAAAGTALHKQAYSSIVSGTDSGTASYANSAGSANSVAWGNVTGKPSTFAPSSHTHNYAGSSSAGGAATSAIKLSTPRKIGNASFDGTADITLSQMGLNVPVEITKANYLAKKKAGTLNANTYYNVIDEYDSANVINDSSVTANSAFSSTKSEKTYAKKSTLVNTTLTASKWTGSSAPYSYVLSVSGVTSSNIVEIDYASNASSAAIEAYQNAMLADGGQTTNQITIKATEKPTVDIPITIVIRNDL